MHTEVNAQNAVLEAVVCVYIGKCFSGACKITYYYLKALFGTNYLHRTIKNIKKWNIYLPFVYIVANEQKGKNFEIGKLVFMLVLSLISGHQNPHCGKGGISALYFLKKKSMFILLYLTQAYILSGKVIDSIF